MKREEGEGNKQEARMAVRAGLPDELLCALLLQLRLGPD